MSNKFIRLIADFGKAGNATAWGKAELTWIELCLTSVTKLKNCTIRNFSFHLLPRRYPLCRLLY